MPQSPWRRECAPREIERPVVAETEPRGQAEATRFLRDALQYQRRAEMVFCIEMALRALGEQP